MSSPAHGPTDDGGEPHAFFQHHYNTVQQQAAAAKLGMWAFLATEILMFSGLFLAYFIVRMFYPEMVLGSGEAIAFNASGGQVATMAELRAEDEAQAAADRLVAAAIAAGGHDNVTAIVLDATLISR